MCGCWQADGDSNNGLERPLASSDDESSDVWYECHNTLSRLSSTAAAKATTDNPVSSPGGTSKGGAAPAAADAGVGAAAGAAAAAAPSKRQADGNKASTSGR